MDSDPVKRPTIAEIVDELNKIDNAKRSLPDQDNLQTTQAKQQRNFGVADAEGAMIVQCTSTGTKDQEHRILEQNILEKDPSDT